jgi:hypothetical protein
MRRQKYLDMLNAIVGVISDNPTQHHKDVVKQILRLYSHGQEIKETPEAIAELQRRKKNTEKNRKNDDQWVPLSIHHEYKISELAGEVIEKHIFPKEAMAKSIIRTRMTQKQHEERHSEERIMLR